MSSDNPVVKARDQKQRTKEELIKLIKENQPIRFKELLEYSDLSNRWLSEMLKELVSDGLIMKGNNNVKLKNGQEKKNVESYTLTEEGNKVYRRIWPAFNSMADLRQDLSDYVEFGYSLGPKAHYSRNDFSYGNRTSIISSKNIDPSYFEITKMFIRELGRRARQNVMSGVIDLVVKKYPDYVEGKKEGASGKIVFYTEVDLSKLIGDIDYYFRFIQDLENGRNPLFNNPVKSLGVLYDSIVIADRVLKNKVQLDNVINWVSGHLKDFSDIYDLDLDLEMLIRLNTLIESEKSPFGSEEYSEKFKDRPEWKTYLDYYLVLKIINFRSRQRLEELDRFWETRYDTYNFNSIEEFRDYISSLQ